MWLARLLPSRARRFPSVCLAPSTGVRGRLGLEWLEPRLAPATLRFSSAGATVNQNAGTFSIPVLLSGPLTGLLTGSPFAWGFSGPDDLAFDASGNLFVANSNGTTVSEVTPAGVVRTFASGFAKPLGVAFDANGNLYVSDVRADTVYQVTPAGEIRLFAFGFSSPAGLAFDAAGNLYVANENPGGIGFVSKVSPAGVVSTFASGFNDPTGLAFDTSGNLYVANFYGNTVDQVTPAGVIRTFASGFNEPNFLAFAGGNLYVPNAGADKVSKVTSGGGISTFATDFSGPAGLAFDASGHLFVSDFSATTVDEVNTATVPFSLTGTAITGLAVSGLTASPLTFGIGQTKADITGHLIDDGFGNPDRTLVVTLAAPTGATLGSQTSYTLIIHDSDSQPRGVTLAAPTLIIHDSDSQPTAPVSAATMTSVPVLSGTTVQNANVRAALAISDSNQVSTSPVGSNTSLLVNVAGSELNAANTPFQISPSISALSSTALVGGGGTPNASVVDPNQEKEGAAVSGSTVPDRAALRSVGSNQAPSQPPSTVQGPWTIQSQRKSEIFGSGNEESGEELLDRDRALGLTDLTEDLVVFGNLFPNADQEDEESAVVDEPGDGMDPNTTALVWFVLTTVACEVALIRGAS
jgi:sugar lactone lactonase YvrE